MANRIKFPMQKMPATMTLKQFLQNPTGPNSAGLARRDIIRNNLEERYSKLLNNHKKIEFRLYRHKGEYLFHFKIPSEEYYDVGVYYDVVLQFIPIEETKGSSTILSYDMKMFSNSPNFTFTYAYVVYNSNLMINSLASKFNNKALTQPPSVRNPVETLGFEKSCYFAALYITNHDLHKISNIDANLSPFNSKTFLDNISSDEKILMMYNKAKKIKAEKRREEKKKLKKKQETTKKATSRRKKL